ncbi:MAG: hypothetical protein IID46_00100 [Planctomycetes bacterium]|nr:hypothetical protein [Planctomycetota bacterium]
MTEKLPIPFAADREATLSNVIDLKEYPALFAAWNRSAKTLTAVKDRLHQVDQRVATVAVSGSLGRMEQLDHSDGDFIVLLKDGISLDSSEAQDAFQNVWSVLNPLGLEKPKTTGIYASPSNQAELCDPVARGQVDEDVSTFGKRIQLLLDCQPVYGADAFRNTIDSVIERYTSGTYQSDNETIWKYLLDDLIRYFRSLSVMSRWEAQDRPGYWRLRNVKLRHTRLMMYAGLLLLMGEADRQPDKGVDWLKDRLSLTALERVAFVYAQHGDENFSPIAKYYERYLSRLGDSDFFAALTDDEDCEREEHPQYRELEKNSQELLAELSRFIIQKQNQWNPRFRRALFF